MGRYLISAVLGGVVTLALAYLMQVLIFTEFELPEERDDLPVIVITMDPPVEESLPERPIRPTEDDVPPPPPPFDPNLPEPTNGDIAIDVPPLPPVDPGDIARIQHQLTPMVRVPPNYPRNALANGIEGFVIVVFEVNAEGNTQNLDIFASEPGSIFDSAALRAVSNWRYQAQTDAGGNPVTVGGQRVRLDFTIDDGEGGEE